MTTDTVEKPAAKKPPAKKTATKKTAAKKPKKEKPKKENAKTIDDGPDPWKQARPAHQLDDLDVLKALIYGPNGSGKTQMGALFRKPLIGPTELQGIPTIRKTNPNAVIYHDAEGKPGIKTVKDLRRFVRMARTAAAQGCDAVVLDGLTDAQRILRTHYTSRQGKKAGTSKTSQESWGATIDATGRLARELRDLAGVHVLVTCLEREVEAADEMVHRPALSGKNLPHEIGEYFNVVGYAHQTDTERGLRHQVLFRSDFHYIVKPLHGLDTVEPPEPQLWISKALGVELAADTKERIDEWEAMSLPFEDDEEEEEDEDNDNDNDDA